jgi:hypothetical protein
MKGIMLLPRTPEKSSMISWMHPGERRMTIGSCWMIAISWMIAIDSCWMNEHRMTIGCLVIGCLMIGS